VDKIKKRLTTLALICSTLANAVPNAVRVVY